MGTFNDLSGQKFGRWTVLYRSHPNKGNKKTYWHCRCECGKESDVDAYILKKGQSSSCGCWQKEVARISAEIARSSLKCHHGSRTRLYHIWTGMKQRCYNKNHKYYMHYGGKNITVCDKWKNNFEEFRSWAYENGYDETDKDLSIDRIDNGKGYSPKNCRWIDKREQPKNRSTNHIVAINNETMIISECSRRYKIPISTIAFRERHGRDLLTGKTHQTHCQGETS